MGLGEELKRIRRKSLMNQTEFAKAIGVSFSSINRWENNKTSPNYQDLKKIKNYCEKNKLTIDMDELRSLDECN